MASLSNTMKMFFWMYNKSIKYLALLPLFIFFNCNNGENLPDPLEAGWNGKPVCEVLEETEGLRVLKCTFKPKVGHELHYHNPHFGYTLAGSKFRIKDASGVREINVPTGYSFAKDNRSTHEVLNIGDSTAVFLIVEYK